MSDRAAPVAVVIVTWNSSRWMPDCLDSLRILDRPAAEVVVDDSGSTDHTACFTASVSATGPLRSRATRVPKRAQVISRCW